MKLQIAYLYPDQLNLYGDRGNVLTLFRRCQWRDISAEIQVFHPGDAIDASWADLYFMGGGQDSQQFQVCDDLHQIKALALKQAAKLGAVFLTVCGGYQLLGHYYKTATGEEIPGLSLMDVHTVAGENRFIGNVAIQRNEGQTVVGFENHSGRTFLGADVMPLGKVIHGYGNNGEDGTEGAVCGNLYGTYLHGALLPKNPALCDELIAKALKRRYGDVNLSLLDDAIEHQAHQSALALR
ncbi:MAG: glutamine amidotransferase [Cyanobacteria bacterium P01_H01_bin.74]